MVRFSLIIPIHNSELTLPLILPGLEQLSPEWEVIVVDDASKQSPREVVAELLPRARFQLSDRDRGAASARNCGAGLAKGEYLCFLDSDVLVKAATLEAMLNKLSNGDSAGIFGRYSARVWADHSAVGKFRNLLHRAVHRRCAGLVASFWTGLGAVSRHAFEDVGGFDESLSRAASIEDVELGARLHRAGFLIELDPRFEAVHLKNWTWSEMAWTDVFHRAYPWTRLILAGRLDPETMNGGWPFRLPPLLLLLAVALAPLKSGLSLAVTALYLAASLSLCVEIASEGGLRVALVTLPGLFLHHVCSWLGAGLACLASLRDAAITSFASKAAT